MWQAFGQQGGSKGAELGQQYSESNVLGWGSKGSALGQQRGNNGTAVEKYWGWNENSSAPGQRWPALGQQTAQRDGKCL